MKRIIEKIIQIFFFLAVGAMSLVVLAGIFDASNSLEVKISLLLILFGPISLFYFLVYLILKNVKKNKTIDLCEDEIENEKLPIDTIQNKLKQKATIFEVGGRKPSNELLESWIGKVCWQEKNENIPKDNNGNDMKPLITLFLKDLPYCHSMLKDINLITIFMSEDIFDDLADEELKEYFCIKTYNSLENLEKCNYTSDMLSAFPIYPKLVENDYPLHDSGYDIIVDEDEYEYDYYDDVFEENYSCHKIGGYPSHVQGFTETDNLLDEGYNFVLQIISDEKIGLDINFYFYYNPSLKEWKVFCDFI